MADAAPPATRRALVTGASRGIGAAIAKRLGAEGFHVVVHYGSSAEAAQEVAAAIEAQGGQATCCQADLQDPDAASALIDVAGAGAALDVLVNNAGVTRDGLLLAMRPAAWEDVLRVNLDSVMRLTQRALRGMIRARRGAIVNMSSVQALRGGKGQANYAAAKAALLALTRAAALEVAERGIRVNAVCPGFIRTDMTAKLERSAGAEILKHIPLGRFGEADDVANLVAFLVSDEAAYITGQHVVVDGGLSIG